MSAGRAPSWLLIPWHLQEQLNKPSTLFTKSQLSTIIRGNETKYIY